MALARPQTSTTEEDQVIGYCMKCRAERDIANAKTVTMKNGRPATEGNCPACGTRMYRLGKV
jgi:hypothetical protein